MAIIKLYEYMTMQKNHALMKKTLKAFGRNRDINMKNRERVKRLLNIFRKYQTYHTF